MSAEDVKHIIGRAVLEAEYRELLFSDPDAALEGYDLTEEEREALKKFERGAFDELAGELEERMSRAGFGFQQLGGLGGQKQLNDETMNALNQAMRQMGGSKSVAVSVTAIVI